jgi:hypothetical protein
MDDSVKHGVTLFGLLMVTVWILGGLGWILNLVKIFDRETLVVTGELVVRVIGVFIAPVGAVFGYF